jgi:hypothetical protein
MNRATESRSSCHRNCTIASVREVNKCLYRRRSTFKASALAAAFLAWSFCCNADAWWCSTSYTGTDLGRALAASSCTWLTRFKTQRDPFSLVCSFYSTFFSVSAQVCLNVECVSRFLIEYVGHNESLSNYTRRRHSANTTQSLPFMNWSLFLASLRVACIPTKCNPNQLAGADMNHILWISYHILWIWIISYESYHMINST